MVPYRPPGFSVDRHWREIIEAHEKNEARIEELRRSVIPLAERRLYSHRMKLHDLDKRLKPLLDYQEELEGMLEEDGAVVTNGKTEMEAILRQKEAQRQDLAKAKMYAAAEKEAHSHENAQRRGADLTMKKRRGYNTAHEQKLTQKNARHIMANTPGTPPPLTPDGSPSPFSRSVGSTPGTPPNVGEGRDYFDHKPKQKTPARISRQYSENSAYR